MKWLAGGLVLVFMLLQIRLWVGERSLAEIYALEQRIDNKTAENSALELQNQQLKARIHSLKDGTDSVEEKARSELGLVKEGEIFVITPNQP